MDLTEFYEYAVYIVVEKCMLSGGMGLLSLDLYERPEHFAFVDYGNTLPRKDCAIVEQYLAVELGNDCW